MRMFDGLINFVSRIGTSSDKAAHGRYELSMMDGIDIEEAYRTSWFRKICDIPPFDEVREWRTWTGADDAQITAIDAEEKRLGLRHKVAEARTLARKDGGSAILIGTGSGNPMVPLKPENIGKGGLRYITVCNRTDITPRNRISDPNSPMFGEPASYMLNGTSVEIDASRVIRFIGNPIRMQGFWDGWGESIWIELREAVKHADQIAASVSALVDEAKIDVIRIKGLMSGLATVEYENLLTRRWAAMATFKSSQNALLLDADDEYEQKTLTFAGLPDIQDRALMIMSGMADIPATRLLGRSPQGMNATGDSDMRNYYDRIRAGQIMHVQPKLHPLDECLIRSALNERPKEIYYEWNPLYTLSEKEAADIEKQFAETADKYASSALIPNSALAAMVKDGVIERGQWPGAQQAFEGAEAANELPGLLEEPSEAELAEEQARTALALTAANDPAAVARPRPQLVSSRDARFMDASPRTLYVRRDVVNVAEITKWARAQGFTDILPDMHVTIISSRIPIDWMVMGSDWDDEMKLPAGGPRLVETLGSFHVLLFASRMLEYRHQAAMEAGASWDFPTFQPHISIQKGGDMPANVTPYRGKIVLGPEIFEERKPD